MILDEFIKEVIVSIHKGIDKAQLEGGKEILPNSGLISESIPYVKYGVGPTAKSSMISNVEFEVSLINSDKDGVSGGIGVLLGAISLGAKGSNEKENISHSKVKFNIPIKLG